MGKYFGYAAIIVGLYILLSGLSFFYLYGMGTGDPNTATAFVLRNTPFAAILLISAVVSVIGLMISYYGWTDIKKWKAIGKLAY